MNAPRIETYRDREALATGLAEIVAAELKQALAARGAAKLAIPGGTTPGPMLRALGGAGLDWANVTVTLTDERCVPISSPRSNARLLAETLFAGAAAAARFVPLYGGIAEPAQALGAIVTGLETTALPLDVAVLGMGADMHTASMFPGAVGLDASLADDAPAAVAIRAAGAEEARVTLSARALNTAPARHLMIAGAEKRAALERAIALGNPREAPVLAILKGATVHYAD